MINEHRQSAGSRKAAKGTDNRFMYGAVATGAYVLGFLIYAAVSSDIIIGLKPNEFAEFLAGIFGPLAFLWLVLGFLQQGDELRNSADALRLQEEELHNLVEQQSQLVQVTREQFVHERKRAEAAEKEAARLAQPTLVLRGGSSRTAEGKLLKRYFLENVGTTCTDLRIDFGGLRNDASIASLANGESREYEFAFDREVFESTQIKVNYRDARGKRDTEVFTLRKTGATISVLAKEGVAVD
jgi:hypothetical protein